MLNPIDFTDLLPEVEQTHLGGIITGNQFIALSVVFVAMGLLVLAGFHARDFFVPPAKGSVMDYRPAPIAGNMGHIVTPAEAKIKFRAAHPEWREVGE
ncbi:MAG: hypothetical protein WA003_15715 [Desulfuromonadaceae bacterium]